MTVRYEIKLQLETESLCKIFVLLATEFASEGFRNGFLLAMFAPK